MTEGDQLRIVSSSPNALDQHIYGIERLEVPDIENSYMDLLPIVLERRNLPYFNEGLIRPLTTEMLTRRNGFEPTYNEVFVPRVQSQRISSEIYFVSAELPDTLIYSMYEIGRKYYRAYTLTFENIVAIKNRIKIDLSTLTSKPLLLITSDGAILLMTDGDQVRIIGSSFNALDQPIINIRPLKVPDLSSYSSVEQLLFNLPELNLPEFNLERLHEIQTIVENGPILYDQLISSLIETLPIVNNNDSIILHGLKVNFIPFEEIANLLSQNQIERYIIDPSLQYLTIAPNVVLTMFRKNGLTYLVKARYDQRSNQIFPPV